MKKNVKVLWRSPLKVTARAIRTCWQSFDKGDDGGEKDKALIKRVGVKSKHSSTLEHSHLVFETRNQDVAYEFIVNPFSLVFETEDGKFIINTNLRVLIENQVKLSEYQKEVLLGDEYAYLIKEGA